MGRLEEALQSVEQAIAREPELANAHKGRAAVLLALGRDEEAGAARAKAAALEKKAQEKKAEPAENGGGG